MIDGGPRMLVLTATLLAACSGHLRVAVPDEVEPSRWHLRAHAIDIAINDEPYSLVVRNAAGTAVLASNTLLPGSGRSPLGWTSGEVRYEQRLSPGYTRVEPRLLPYHDDFEVVDASATGDEVRLKLEPREGEGPAVWVTHRVRPGVLRVTAELENGVPRAWSVGFGMPAGEQFLGFGERFNRVGQRGRLVFSWAEEGGVGLGEGQAAGPSNPWPSGEVMTTYPVPFFVSTRGYGFWLDTTYYSEFDLGREDDGAWRASHVGPKLAYEVYVPDAHDERPWPYQLTDRFTAATGRPMLPPGWAFGPRRRISRGAQAEDTNEIQAMRDSDLALTSIDDATHFFPAASHRGKEALLRDWVEQATALGYRVNAYYNSFVQRGLGEGPFAELQQGPDPRSLFLHRADGSLPSLWIVTGGHLVSADVIDLTHPAAIRAYQDTFKWALDLGYSGWMYDFGEYVASDIVAADGQSGEELHNAYPVQYARVLNEAMESSPRRGDWLAFMRSGYTGASHYVPLAWSGDPAASFEDADGLPSMVRAGLNLGISGVPFWGGDIGGYHCVADGSRAANEELMVRWIQQGALSPSMQDQNACVGAKASHKASLWNSRATRQAWQTYARLHTRLFPYLYAWAKYAHETGAPLMRSLFFEHPENARLAGVDDAYYFGPALLAAPIVQRGQRSKEVELPDSFYLDWDSKALVLGGLRKLDAPLERLPLLLRPGQIVPLLDDSIDTLAVESNPDVVGPSDVADVYDATVLLSPSVPEAHFVLDDGSVLEARLLETENALECALPAGELEHCEGCAQINARPDHVHRVRASGHGQLRVGDVELRSSSVRRIRWDVFVADRH
jgi:alpha-glucosidase